MPLTTYAELKTSIQDWVNHDSVTDAVASDLVTLFEAVANRFLADKRLIVMSTTDTAFTIDSEYETAPTTALDVLAVEIPDATRPYRLTGTTADAIARMAYDKQAYALMQNDIYGTDTSPPKHFAQVGTQLRFFPVPVTSYTATITYTQRIPALADGANWLFSAHPDIYLWGALTEAEAYVVNDERSPTWKAKRDEGLAQLLSAYPRARDFTGLRTEIGVGRFPYR